MFVARVEGRREGGRDGIFRSTAPINKDDRKENIGRLIDILVSTVCNIPINM